MKHFIISVLIVIAILAALCISNVMNAQLYVQSGAILSSANNATITLQNQNLVNNGTITQVAGDGVFLFNGTSNATISGSGSSTFDVMETAKTSSGNLTLQQPINIVTGINFTSGIIDLNNNNIFLQPNALLTNESEASRITGLSGGYIQITKILNVPNAVNLGNLGAVITSTQNLGSTTIRRGHEAQAVNAFNSVNRYFDIIPTNNNALNATLRINYFDAELNTLNENILSNWQSINTSSWNDIGFTSRNTLSNYVEKTSCPSFYRHTLSQPEAVLNLKLFIAGYYVGGNTMTPTKANEGIGTSILDVDTVTLELRDPNSLTPPNNLVASTKTMLQTNGNAFARFGALLFGNYYLVVKHRNAIETWSANPIAITASTNYDFTTAANKAYGNNQVQVEPNVFAFYTGDINQDGSIDGSDVVDIENGTESSAFGYLAADLNGDGSVDGSDYPLWDANAGNSIYSIHP